MEKHLANLLSKVPGLYTIVVGDRDGVPILKASLNSIPETALRPSFLSTFSMASLQGGKLGIGKNKTIICMYTSYQVVQVCDQGLIVTFIGQQNCNTGHILAIARELSPVLEDIRSVLRTEQLH